MPVQQQFMRRELRFVSHLAVYTFFDPEPNKSYGTYNVLWQIEQTKLLNLAHVYLGYWIGRSGKMAYKSQFAPHELLLNGHWQPAPASRPTSSVLTPAS